MDERVHLVRKPSGAVELRVKVAVVDELGMDALAAEVASRGIDAAELGEPRRSGSRWVIPVRKKGVEADDL